jgi:hypothetical protein
MRTVPFKRTPPTGRRALVWCLACCLNVLIAPAAMAQDGRLEIEYTVKVADIPGQLFHVTTDIRNINQPALDLSLPVWSPGWYVIENYAKNIFRFRVTEPGGRQLRPALVRKQTWRIDTRGISHHRRVRLSGGRSRRESGAHRAGLRVLHRHAALPSARGSSIETQ